MRTSPGSTAAPVRRGVPLGGGWSRMAKRGPGSRRPAPSFGLRSRGRAAPVPRHRPSSPCSPRPIYRRPRRLPTRPPDAPAEPRSRHPPARSPEPTRTAPSRPPFSPTPLHRGCVNGGRVRDERVGPDDAGRLEVLRARPLGRGLLPFPRPGGGSLGGIGLGGDRAVGNGGGGPAPTPLRRGPPSRLRGTARNAVSARLQADGGDGLCLVVLPAEECFAGGRLRRSGDGGRGADRPRQRCAGRARVSWRTTPRSPGRAGAG